MKKTILITAEDFRVLHDGTGSIVVKPVPEQDPKAIGFAKADLECVPVRAESLGHGLVRLTLIDAPVSPLPDGAHVVSIVTTEKAECAAAIVPLIETGRVSYDRSPIELIDRDDKPQRARSIPPIAPDGARVFTNGPITAIDFDGTPESCEALLKTIESLTAQMTPEERVLHELRSRANKIPMVLPEPALLIPEPTLCERIADPVLPWYKRNLGIGDFARNPGLYIKLPPLDGPPVLPTPAAFFESLPAAFFESLPALLDAPSKFRIYAIRAQPIADSDPQPGDTAPRSYIWEDGKPTDRLDIGTGAILWFTVEDAREIAKSFAVQVPLARKFRRAFNLLRQYALIHADESPQRLYRFVLLGADTACTSGEDFEVNVVNPTVLYSCVLGCVDLEGDADARRVAYVKSALLHGVMSQGRTVQEEDIKVSKGTEPAHFVAECPIEIAGAVQKAAWDNLPAGVRVDIKELIKVEVRQ